MAWQQPPLQPSPGPFLFQVLSKDTSRKGPREKATTFLPTQRCDGQPNEQGMVPLQTDLKPLQALGQGGNCWIWVLPKTSGTEE